MPVGLILGKLPLELVGRARRAQYATPGTDPKQATARGAFGVPNVKLGTTKPWVRGLKPGSSTPWQFGSSGWIRRTAADDSCLAPGSVLLEAQRAGPIYPRDYIVVYNTTLENSMASSIHYLQGQRRNNLVSKSRSKSQEPVLTSLWFAVVVDSPGPVWDAPLDVCTSRTELKYGWSMA
jgi:hypothetical protein